jgi:hypothetical protein
MQGVDDDVDVAEIGGLTIEEKMIAATLRDLTAMARSV